MFRHIKQLAYTVRVDEPNPLFAKMLQQAIGGIEGEMRVMNQYLFQAWSFRGPTRYKDMLLNTGTEEIGHIEMLATAVALNLEGAETKLQESAAASNGAVNAVLGGQDPRPCRPTSRRSRRTRKFSYTLLLHSDAVVADGARWTSGPSVDSKGTFEVQEAEAYGGPLSELAPPEERPELHSAVIPAKGGFMRKAKDAITP